MVRVAAQKDHAARHHRLGVRVGDLEAQNFGVEPGRALHVAHIENDMPELADAERQAMRPLDFFDALGIVHRRSPQPRGKTLMGPAILQ